MSKKLRVFLTTLLSVLVLFGVALPSAALAATVRPTTGTLSIHKLQYNTELAPVIENDGLEVDLPTGTSPLNGVTFKVYKVADDATDQNAVPVGNPTRVVETSGDGLASFVGLDQGRYLVVEDRTNAPEGIETFSPNVLVDVPMMNPDNVTWNENVHVYPKNQLVLGHAQLEKRFPGYTGISFPAMFSLYKDGGTPGTADDTYIGNFLTDPITGRTPEIRNLLKGNYYFIETQAPIGFGLNKTPIPFEVTYSNHNVTQYFTDDNYLVPTIDKFLNTIDNQHDTANFNELNKWIIQSTIPGDIADYESYVITDDLSEYLDYEDALTVKVGNVNLAYTFIAPAIGTPGPQLEISIDPQALKNYTGQKVTIEFKTSINENAPMNDEIENEATIVATLDDTPYADVSEKAEVHTGGKKFVKVGETADSAGLAGAQFKIKKAGTNLYLQNNWTWSDAATDRDDRVFTSGSDGTFEVKGLAYGDNAYTLVEIKAPTGYKLRGDVTFTVDKGSYDATAAKITNSPTLLLPSTGGMGTIVFTVIGSVLMIGAVKLYKKDSVEE